MLELSPAERRSLRARAHALNPVVSISQNGLSEAVLKEIDVSLKSHELIKIRVFNDDREARNAWLAEICEKLGAAPVQHIGKLLVIWRPEPVAPAPAPRSVRKVRITKKAAGENPGRAASGKTAAKAAPRRPAAGREPHAVHPTTLSRRNPRGRGKA